MDDLKSGLTSVKSKKVAYADTTKSIDEMIALLQATTETIQNGGGDVSMKSLTGSVTSIARAANESKSAATKNFKNLSAAVSDFGSGIEKHVPSDIERVVSSDVFSPTTVNEVIADALLREARFGIAQTLATETAASAASTARPYPLSSAALDTLRVAFEELHSVVAALRARNLNPAITWATKERDRLRAELQSPHPLPHPMHVSAGSAASAGPLPAQATAKQSLTANAMDTSDSGGGDPPSASASATASTHSASTVTANANRLEAISDLLFGLHRLRFLQLLTIDSPCTVHHIPASAPGSAAAAATNKSTLHEKSDLPTAMNISSPPASPPQPSPSPPLLAGTGAAAATPYVPPSQSALQSRMPYTLKALQYAQLHFAPFAHTHLHEIQRLSGCVLFGWDLVRASQARSPIVVGANGSAAAAGVDLASPALWSGIESSFRRVCYMRLGISERNPLLVTLLASDIALPKLLKCAAIMQSNTHLLTTGTTKQLVHILAAAEIDLGREYQYHSTFICPVTKDQATTDNPPLLLKCGHVISFAAMQKMTRSNHRLNRSGKFKCPTCPKEQLPTEALEIYF